MRDYSVLGTTYALLVVVLLVVVGTQWSYLTSCTCYIIYLPYLPTLPYIPHLAFSCCFIPTVLLLQADERRAADPIRSLHTYVRST